MALNWNKINVQTNQSKPTSGGLDWSKIKSDNKNITPTFKTPEDALAYAKQNNIKVANTVTTPKIFSAKNFELPAPINTSAGDTESLNTPKYQEIINKGKSNIIKGDLKDFKITGATAGDTLSETDLKREQANKEIYRNYSEKYINQINQQNEQAKNQGTFDERMKAEAELYSEYQKQYNKAKKENNLELMAKYSALMNNSEFAKEVGKLNYDAGKFGANYTYGALGTDLNETVSNYLKYPYSEQNLENKEKIRQAEELMRIYSENAKNYGKGGLITKDFASYAPQAVDQFTEGIKGAFGGGVAGGTIGTAVSGGPGAGTITGAVKGAKLGYAANVARYSYNQMLGGAYKDLIDLGVPEDIALEIATDTALWQSIVEGVGAGVDLATLGVGKLFSKGAKTGAQLTAKKMIQEALKAYGINLASETAEEAIQEKIAIEGEKKALEQAGIERKSTNKDDWKRIGEAGFGGFKIALVTGGGNVIGNVTVNTINNATINSVNKQYDEYIDEVKKSNLTETQKQEMIADAENGRQETMNAIQEQLALPEYSGQIGKNLIDGYSFRKQVNEANIQHKSPTYIKNDLAEMADNNKILQVTDVSGNNQFVDSKKVSTDVENYIKNMPNVTIKENGKILNVTGSGIDEISSKGMNKAKRQAVTELQKSVENSTYINSAPDSKNRQGISFDYYASPVKTDNGLQIGNIGDRIVPGLEDTLYSYDIKNRVMSPMAGIGNPTTQILHDTTPITNIIPNSQNYVNNQQINLSTQAEQQAEQEAKRSKLSTQEQQTLEKGKNILKETLENISKNENANKVSYTNDFYRNMRTALGEQAGKELTKQFDNSKLNHVKLKQKYANELKTYIVDELGIKLNSEMSADVQKFGEKQITEVKLKTKYPDTWQNIVEADKWFRTKYDELIDAINETRKEIYPNVEEKIQETKDALLKTYDLIKQAEKTGIAPYKMDEDIQDNIRRLDERIAAKQEKIKEIEDKNRPNYQKTKKYNNLIEQQELLEQNKNELERLIGKRYDEKVARLKKRAQRLSDTLNGEELWRGKRIPKRENYYRHFQEMAEGFKALHNIFTTPSDISSNLSGTSEYTKPKSKFLGLAQKRTTNETEYDAVGGFLNYLEPASYAINIDPFITELRDISQTIKNNTLETKNANKLTEYLDDFAGSLAGKTNPFDRPVQKIAGRKAMKALEWTANRIKSNAVLGNINSSISQILNLPQVVGKIKDPRKLAQGVGDLVFGNGKYQDSQFIQERYHSDVISQFNTKLTQQPKKFATWMLGALDEGVTKAGWNAVYRQAIEKGIDNPIKYADDTMRSLVAGRGIGERTLAQESKLTNLLMPFTVETGNYWRVMKDFVNEKDFGGILITFIVGWLLNRVIEAIGASGKTFDPIDAIYDAITEEDIGILQRIGRVGGEILSSMPMGQQIASLYPEYGADFGIFELPGREELFGSNDPTRFGTGNVLGKVFSNPVTGVALPWGGTQLRRTLEGANALIKGGDYKTNSKGEEQLKFPIDLQNMNTPQKIGTTLQTLTLGKYAVPTADDYFEDGALTALQTKGYKKALDTGLSAKEFYEIMNAIENIKVPTLKNKEGKEEAVQGARKKLIKEELDSRRNLTDEQRKLFYDIFYSRELK